MKRNWNPQFWTAIVPQLENTVNLVGRQLRLFKGSGNNDRNRYTASKWQRYVPPCRLWPSGHSDDIPLHWVGTLIPAWRRNTTATQNDCVWSSTSGSLFYIKLPPALSSFAARSLCNTALYPVCKLEPVANFWLSLTLLTALGIIQCIKSTDYMFWSFST